MGDTVPHLTQRSVQFHGSGENLRVSIDGAVHYPGTSGTSHNNCLVFSLTQLLHISCHADEIRERLCALNPRTVTETNFLDFFEHTFDLLEVLLSMFSADSAVQRFARNTQMH